MWKHGFGLNWFLIWWKYSLHRLILRLKPNIQTVKLTNRLTPPDGKIFYYHSCWPNKITRSLVGQVRYRYWTSSKFREIFISGLSYSKLQRDGRSITNPLKTAWWTALATIYIEWDDGYSNLFRKYVIFDFIRVMSDTLLIWEANKLILSPFWLKFRFLECSILTFLLW